VISMLPVHVHEHFELLESAFTSSIVVSAAPGDQGPDTTGTQGMGVSAPMAAAVAAATSGFAWVWHISNGAMFTIGFMSMTVAAGLLSPLAGPMGGW
jgi:hypothetical protein